MVQLCITVLGAIRVFFRARGDTGLEILALRPQLAVLKRQRPRPPVKACDRWFGMAPRRLWSRWAEVLLMVKPETVVGWHRASFRLYWRWRSRPRHGRPRIPREIRDLIGRRAMENPAWGAPQIHAERQKLGFTLAERRVARYLRRRVRRGDPGQKGRAFLANHCEGIAAFACFTVPTATFSEGCIVALSSSTSGARFCMAT